MFVGCCLLSIHIPFSNSLKDKRQVLRSLLQRVRNRFEVAIAEVADNEAWRTATLGIACVTNDSAHAEQTVRAVLAFIEGSRPDCELHVLSLEVVRVSDR